VNLAVLILSVLLGIAPAAAGWRTPPHHALSGDTGSHQAPPAMHTQDTNTSGQPSS